MSTTFVTIRCHTSSDGESLYIQPSAIVAISPAPKAEALEFEERAAFFEKFPETKALLYLAGMGTNNFPIKESPDEVMALIRLSKQTLTSSSPT